MPYALFVVAMVTVPLIGMGLIELALIHELDWLIGIGFLLVVIGVVLHLYFFVWNKLRHLSDD